MAGAHSPKVVGAGQWATTPPPLPLPAVAALQWPERPPGGLHGLPAQITVPNASLATCMCTGAVNLAPSGNSILTLSTPNS